MFPPKLEFGAEVKQQGNVFMCVEYKEHKDKTHEISLLKDRIVYSQRFTEEKFREECETLGTPLTIADVLMMLGKRGEQWALDDDGQLLSLNGGAENGLLLYEGTPMYCNLHLPLSHEANKGFCESVLEIMK